MSFQLPELPYEVDALAPHIDAETMNIHWSKHHQAYVNNLNAAIQGTEHENKSIEELIRNINQLPDSMRNAVRNNGGGHFNHHLFWEIMSPNGGGTPQDELAESINSAFGSLDAFKQQFETAAKTRFGSGWAWLGVKENGQLCVCSTPNQDSPIMDVDTVNCACTPILGLDVWEHAYYLNYQNRRPDYVSAFWNVVNWNKVQENFSKARVAQTST